MVYMQIVLGIGCVVVAAAAAIYFSMPTAAPPHRQHTRRNNNWQGNDNDNDEDYDNNGAHCNNTKKSRVFRHSKPGDKCIVCLEIMTAEAMRTMHCGHALHESPCYEGYRDLCRQCPHCNQVVIRIDLPGDNCSICCEPMELHNIEYLKCEHALHKTCLVQYKSKNYKSCPVCKRLL